MSFTNCLMMLNNLITYDIIFNNFSIQYTYIGIIVINLFIGYLQ